jgi:hypothetical protein
MSEYSRFLVDIEFDEIHFRFWELLCEACTTSVYLQYHTSIIGHVCAGSMQGHPSLAPFMF